VLELLYLLCDTLCGVAIGRATPQSVSHYGEKNMDILQLIDRLEELFNAAKAVPFTHNVVVDEDRMLELIDQMRIAIPEEVKKAQQVMAQRDRVMAQAQEEANRTLQLSRDKADQMVQKDMIMQEAQRRADQIVSQARAEAESTRVDADNYVVDTLMQLQDQISKLSGQVSNGIRMVQEDQMRKASSSEVSEKEG
jgi:cell division septum initiation protein DivIVA